MRRRHFFGSATRVLQPELGVWSQYLRAFGTYGAMRPDGAVGRTASIQASSSRATTSAAP